MKRVSSAALVAIALSGCLAVNPPGAHMGGVGNDAATSDALTSDAGPSDGGLTPIPANQFCTRIAEVACSGYLTCCNTHSGDMATCTMSLAMECSSRLGSIIVDARTGYDESVAAEVIAEGQALADVCSTDIVAWYNSRTGMQRALQGTLAGGAACSTSASDLPAYFSCRSLGQSCIGSGMNFHCLDRLEASMPCFVSFDCVELDYCMGGLPIVGIPGQCARRQPMGAMCSADSDCDSYLCDTTTTPHRCAALDPQDAYCGLH